MKEEKREEWERREGNMYRTVLFLLRLLFKLLWKTVTYWVDPAAFVQQSLQAEILPGSNDLLQKQKAIKKLNKRIKEGLLLV